MSRNVKVYCYQHKKFITTTETIKDAANLADTNATMVRSIILQKTDCTRDGWVFATEPLTEEEMQDMPDCYGEKRRTLRKQQGSCVKKINKQEYAVACGDGMVGFIPKTKDERKMLLRQIVYHALSKRWTTEITEKVATLEKQVISELIDSI